MTLANESYQVTSLEKISNISAGSHLQLCLLKIKDSVASIPSLMGLQWGRKISSKWPLRARGNKAEKRLDYSSFWRYVLKLTVDFWSVNRIVGVVSGLFLLSAPSHPTTVFPWFSDPPVKSVPPVPCCHHLSLRLLVRPCSISSTGVAAAVLCEGIGKRNCRGGRRSEKFGTKFKSCAELPEQQVSGRI